MAFTADERRVRFEALFSAVYEPLQRYVRRRATAADADDVVAETLLVLWRRLDDVLPEVPLAWTYGVARRCLANHRRGIRRGERLVAKIAIATPTMTTSSVDGDQGDSALEAALAAADDDDRELLRLWAWEQLTASEIATVLGITANAASIRLHRARRRLAERLERAGKPAAAAGHSSSEHGEEGPR